MSVMSVMSVMSIALATSLEIARISLFLRLIYIQNIQNSINNKTIYLVKYIIINNIYRWSMSNNRT
jgi:hypothetical protein